MAITKGYKKSLSRLFPIFKWLIPAFALAAPLAVQAQTLSKVFTPNTIGPGSVSTATFTITNTSDEAFPISGLAFTDVLPAAPGNVYIASPANASTDCVDGVVSAPDGGGTIEFSNGKLGAFQVCTVTVDVTASTAGAHTNPAVTLTYNELAGDPTTSSPIDLTVDFTLPGFSKSFAPSSVSLGGRSTLTFTVDNSTNGSNVTNLDFNDHLPLGMVIADPANASTTCGTATIPPTLIATAGADIITLDANGTSAFPAVAAEDTCTVTVDIIATGIGELNNISGELLASFVSVGKASDTLDVTVTPLALRKSFINDPVPPGGSVSLEFTIDNFDRLDSATAVGFTDDLTSLVPDLAGLTFSSLLSNDCGGSVSGVGGTTISFSGGTVAAESSCSIAVDLEVPPGATPGTYTNTTSTVSGTVGGAPVVGNTASDDLYVEPVPLLTKEFLEEGTLAPDPVVNAGDDVVLRFTVTNTSTTSAATDVTFDDELTDGSGATPPDLTSGFLPFPVTVTLPPVPDPPCGAGSSLALVPAGTDRQALQLTGGTLAPAGTAGDSCTFEVTVNIPTGMGPGTYLNTTEEVSATVDGATRIGPPASDTLEITSAPRLAKAFSDDPVAPGGTVTLEFTLTYPADASSDAIDIAFTDDLTGFVPPVAGLVANGLPLADACDGDGPGGNPGSGTLSESGGVLTFMGGILSPGESCTFTTTLDVPAGTAAGAYTNTTSSVSAMVAGLAVTSPPASDTLDVAGLTFTKEFLGDPALPGETLTLRFTIDNIHPTLDATITFFTDNLAAGLTGLAATGPAILDSCGGSLSGTTFLTYTGGSLLSGSSCTIEVEVLIPAGAADGDYRNTTSSLAATQGGATTISPATDVLTVNSTLLQLTKEFTDDPVTPHSVATLEFTLTNLDAMQAISAVAFTDDLGAALTGLTFNSVLFDNCMGTVLGTGTDKIDVSGVYLAANATCELRVSVSIPGGTAEGIYLNTTSDITGTMAGFTVSGSPASDDLQVVQLLSFSKSFDGPTTATGTSVLSFIITNPGPDTASSIAFIDDLNSVIPGLVATSLPALPCGAGSAITGVSQLNLTGGELAANGGSCSFDVELLIPATAVAGTFPNSTSDLLQGGLKVADPATADLVIEPPPTFAKLFAASTLGLGQTTALTFTVDNSASAVTVSALSFIDNLPAGTEVANPPGASNSCGGTFSAAVGATAITLSGGVVGTGATCTASVNIVAIAVGTHVNITGDLTSSSGNSGTASDTLLILPNPGFDKTFTPNSIVQGQSSTLTFSIDNSGSSVAADGLDFTDTLPANMVVATPASASTTCTGGTLTAAAGSGSISYTGGSIAASSSCTITVDTSSTTVGDLVNTSGNLTSSLGDSGTASDTLTVNGAPVPSFGKVFAPNPIIQGQSSTLTFTIDNASSLVAANGLNFNDNLPAGIEVTTPPVIVNGCGGSLNIMSGRTVINFEGGTVAANVSCTIAVDVTGTGAGSHLNTTGDLTSSLGNSGTASDTLIVNAAPVPGFDKVFAPNPVIQGQNSTLTFTIDNTGGLVAATALNFTDTLPTGMVVATPANASTNCSSGTLTAVSGSGSISYAGGFVAASSSCTVTVDTLANAAGSLANTSGNLISSLGNSGTASDTLTVNAAPVPGFGKVFAPNPVIQGQNSTLTFTIDNTGGLVAATALNFTDTLPAGMVVATPANASTTCSGGSLTGGSGSISYTGGSVTASSSCTVTVDILANAAGSLANTSGDLTSSLGNSGTASDTLTVNGAPVPGFDKVFAPNPVIQGQNSTLTFTIDNTGGLVAATALNFTDTLPAGMLVANPANASTTCSGGTLTAASGSGSISYVGGSVAASSTCILTVDTLANAAGSLVNTSGDLTSSLGNSGTASDTLTVNGALVPGFGKVFVPNPIALGQNSTLTFTIDNTGGLVAATALNFTDTLPAGMLVANPANASTTCTDGALTATADTGSVSYTGGSVAASSSCTVTVDILANAAGSLANTSGDLTSSLGNSGTASDTLEVNVLPTFQKAFDSTETTLGAPLGLTFTIDNSASSLDATNVSFTDDLPAGMLVDNPGNPVSTCIGGVLSAPDDGNVVSYTGGSVPAGTTCTIKVTVVVTVAGTLVNTTEDLTSSLGNSGSSQASITIYDLTPRDIPTLSQWALVLLGMGILLLVVSQQRRHRPGQGS